MLKKYNLKKIREEKGKQISLKLMTVRQHRAIEMIRIGWTLEELVTVPAGTKIMQPKNISYKKVGEAHPELYEEFNQKHHESITRSLAMHRYYQGWSINRSCNQPKRITKGM